MSRPPTSTPEELLLEVGRGSRRAFELLYDQMADVVFGIARRVLIDPARAEEVAQDVLVEVWKTASRFDPARGSALTFVAVMTRRRAIDVVRATESSRKRETRDPGSPPAPDPVADRVVEGDENARVRRAVGDLTDLQRQAIELAFYRGLTHAQIADKLGIPLGTVKARVRDGLLRLGRMVEDGDG